VPPQGRCRLPPIHQHLPRVADRAQLVTVEIRTQPPSPRRRRAGQRDDACPRGWAPRSNRVRSAEGRPHHDHHLPTTPGKSPRPHQQGMTLIGSYSWWRYSG
jgi:hypothetical protein